MSRDRLRATPPISLLLLLLAGCSNPSEPVDEPVETRIEGWVLDPLLRPLAATVEVLETGNQTTTGPDGAYRLSAHAGPLTLRASAPGHETQTRTILVDQRLERLNFSLAPMGANEERVSVQQFDGFIECSAFASAEHSHGGGGPPEGDSPTDCGTYTTTNSRWTVDVPAGIVGIVIEIVWEPGTQLAEHLLVIVEQQFDNGTTEFLAFAEGSSPLKAQVPSFDSSTRFAAGGTLAIDVQIGGGEDDVTIAAAIQQDFQGFTSLFFGKPPDALYSVTV